jgi:putative hydrolase of the HAD superfamily
VNIVFDLGGVVVQWRPEAIAARVFADATTQELVRREVFGHPDWLEQDRGALETESLIARAAARTGLAASEVARLVAAVPPSLEPIPETVDLMYRLREAGHRLYCLSNMGHASIEHLEKTHAFWEVFSGKVISCRLRLCKPEPAIFEHLLAAFDLQAADTVFIDDTEMNTVAAGRLGMQTIRFESPRQCERRLQALGCIPPSAGATREERRS